MNGRALLIGLPDAGGLVVMCGPRATGRRAVAAELADSHEDVRKGAAAAIKANDAMAGNNRAGANGFREDLTGGHWVSRPERRAGRAWGGMRTVTQRRAVRIEVMKMLADGRPAAGAPPVLKPYGCLSPCL